MTLLRHGGLVSPCVVGNVSVARFGMKLLGRRNESWPSAPGSLRQLCIPDLGSDVGHFADLPSDGSERPSGELPGACPEIVDFVCKEPA
jgi:hypothetical protein